MPAAREVRVERQRAIDQRHHGADVLAEIGQREGGIRQDARVVAGHFQGPPARNRRPSGGPPPDLRSGRQSSRKQQTAAQASAGP